MTDQTQVMELAPADAHLLVREFMNQGRHVDALPVLQQLCRIEPDNYQLLHLMAVAKMGVGDYKEALFWLDQAGEGIREEIAAMTCNRVASLGELGRTEEALLLAENVVRNNPGYTQALYLFGILQMQMGQYRESIADMDRVLQMEPGHLDAKFARGFANLVLGNYVEGFEGFEYRNKHVVPLPQEKLWDGQDLSGKSIFLCGEEGYGDVIQFLRFVPLLVKMAAEVHVVVHDGLARIAETIPGVTVWTQDSTTWPETDYWIRMMSLARAFKITRDTVPPPLDLSLMYDWEHKWTKLIPSDERYHVGLCWSGSQKSKYDTHRSIPLRVLAELVDFQNAVFYSFQKDVRPEDRPAFDLLVEKRRLVDLSAHLTDFSQTALAMKRLDMMITCDTSVAHMAGTVGTQTLVLLTKFRTYWLWFQGEDRTPWYPSVTFIRQTTMGDWVEVVRRASVYMYNGLARLHKPMKSTRQE